MPRHNNWLRANESGARRKRRAWHTPNQPSTNKKNWKDVASQRGRIGMAVISLVV